MDYSELIKSVVETAKATMTPEQRLELAEQFKGAEVEIRSSCPDVQKTADGPFEWPMVMGGK
ncbi:MAG: hypothetical protein KKH12_16145 [Gammaproteobacteria bacterium]|nr:hypothetical protein [Gammaproteobacteria bacterium]